MVRGSRSTRSWETSHTLRSARWEQRAWSASSPREIDGSWYEARVSDPYAIYWLRRRGPALGVRTQLIGLARDLGVSRVLDALDELDEPIDQEALPETGTVWKGEMLDGKLVASRWLPIPGGPADTSKLWTFNTATDLQLGLHLLFVNARVGFNPLEFLDLLLGFGGYDIAGDDPSE